VRFPAVLALVCSCSLAYAQGDAARLVAECDSLAASDLDRGRPAALPGVVLVNARAAVPACSAAVAAAPNDGRLRYQLGRAFAAGSQHDKARDSYRTAIAHGSLPAMVDLANMYRFGQGGPRDYGEARPLLEKAAAAGLPQAMYALASMYREGTAVPKDEQLAQHWSQQAKIAFQEDIKLGSPTAMFYVGLMHEFAMGGPRDVVQARLMFEKAAIAGHPGGMVSLARLYENGFGVPRDLAQARSWYESAAKLGNPFAQKKVRELMGR
jgi:TPR repeat protein